MTATPVFLPTDEIFFEYRKYLNDGEPHKHRHSMLAVKRIETDYQCELTPSIAQFKHAHLLMIQVVRIKCCFPNAFDEPVSTKPQNTRKRPKTEFFSDLSARPVQLSSLSTNLILFFSWLAIFKDLHEENKEIELHWLDERDLPEMHLTQYAGHKPTEIQSRWQLLFAKPLSISSRLLEGSPGLKEYTLILVHGGFELTFDHLREAEAVM